MLLFKNISETLSKDVKLSYDKIQLKSFKLDESYKYFNILNFIYKVQSQNNSTKFYNTIIDIQCQKNNKITQLSIIRVNCDCPDFIFHKMETIHMNDSLYYEKVNYLNKSLPKFVKLCKHCLCTLKYTYINQFKLKT